MFHSGLNSYYDLQFTIWLIPNNVGIASARPRDAYRQILAGRAGGPRVCVLIVYF